MIGFNYMLQAIQRGVLCGNFTSDIHLSDAIARLEDDIGEDQVVLRDLRDIKNIIMAPSFNTEDLITSIPQVEDNAIFDQFRSSHLKVALTCRNFYK